MPAERRESSSAGSWRPTVAERKRIVGALIALTDAAYYVPIKKTRRTQEEQQRVEAFTTAYCDARELLDDLARKHYSEPNAR